MMKNKFAIFPTIEDAEQKMLDFFNKGKPIPHNKRGKDYYETVKGWHYDMIMSWKNELQKSEFVVPLKKWGNSTVIKVPPCIAKLHKLGKDVKVTITVLDEEKKTK